MQKNRNLHTEQRAMSDVDTPHPRHPLRRRSSSECVDEVRVRDKRVRMDESDEMSAKTSSS